ncbi:MAG TPA: TMEM175 family protein [Bryobacteraceae bacterium]|nr:TMEM175 family protein [Bryobacteraceae bacterium]
MGKSRLEAFSDAVLAIIITIMVLELKAPHEADLRALQPLGPAFCSYALSFIYIGIYWNNHHHLFHSTQHVSAAMLWANLNLLFWLSLFPFATAWMGENHAAPIPTAAYGGVLLMAAIAYYILQAAILAHEGRNSLLARALGRDWKGKLSPLIYLAAILLAFLSPWISNGLYAFAAMLWMVPDRRIERALAGREHGEPWRRD